MQITCFEPGDHWKVVFNGLLIFAVSRDNHKLIFCQKDWITDDQKKIYTHTYTQ